ncbi:MAG: M16 family metallopeptidase, partial [bacterium]
MLSEYKHKRVVLDSGLTISTFEMPGRRSAAVGLLFRVGSKYDPDNKKGMTHLIEHMLFKGTSRFDACEISRNIEKLGGNIDGYTTHEELTLWAYLPAQ